jgi:ferritin
MLTNKMLSALNAQVQAEMHSSYLYLSIAAYFESMNLRGFAKWMRLQADEEREHAMKFYDFILECGGKVDLAAIAAPQSEWNSALAAFTDVLKHEKKVTSLIHDLYRLSVKEDDLATGVFLQWFIKEQVEEEANASEIVAKLKMNRDSVGGLLVIDHHLGKRGKD